MALSREKIGSIYATIWLKEIYKPRALRKKSDNVNRDSVDLSFNNVGGSALMGILVEKTPQPTLEQMHQFKTNVIDFFVKYPHVTEVCTGVDYGPDYYLRQWLGDAIALIRRLPWKTDIKYHEKKDGTILFFKDRSNLIELQYTPCEEEARTLIVII